MKAIHCTSWKKTELVLEILQKKGWTWKDGSNLVSSYNPFVIYWKKTYILYKDKTVITNMRNCKRFGYEVIYFYDFIKEENISLINLLKMFKKEIKQTFLEVLIGVLVIIGFALFIYITTFNF
jgi:hypothetical protein